MGYQSYNRAQVGSSIGKGHPPPEEKAQACESGRGRERRPLQVRGSKKPGRANLTSRHGPLESKRASEH